MKVHLVSATTNVHRETPVVLILLFTLDYLPRMIECVVGYVLLGKSLNSPRLKLKKRVR